MEKLINKKITNKLIVIGDLRLEIRDNIAYIILKNEQNENAFFKLSNLLQKIVNL
jgi:hypothetical protein